METLCTWAGAKPSSKSIEGKLMGIDWLDHQNQLSEPSVFKSDGVLQQ